MDNTHRDTTTLEATARLSINVESDLAPALHAMKHLYTLMQERPEEICRVRYTSYLEEGEREGLNTYSAIYLPEINSEAVSELQLLLSEANRSKLEGRVLIALRTQPHLKPDFEYTMAFIRALNSLNHNAYVGVYIQDDLKDRNQLFLDYISNNMPNPNIYMTKNLAHAFTFLYDKKRGA